MKPERTASSVRFDLPEQSLGDNKDLKQEKTNKMASHHFSRLVSQDELGEKDVSSNTCPPCSASADKSTEQSMEVDDMPRSPLSTKHVPPLPNPLNDPNVLKHHVSALRIEADLYPLRLILSRLMAHPTYNKKGVFNQPVDAVALGLVDYDQIVKRKMDLGTIKRRLFAVAYPSRLEAIDDIRLVFTNAILYNPPHNPVHISAKELLSLFGSFCQGLDPSVTAGEGKAERPNGVSISSVEPPNGGSISSVTPPLPPPDRATVLSSPSTDASHKASATKTTAENNLLQQPPNLRAFSATRQNAPIELSGVNGDSVPSKLEDTAQRPRFRIPKRRASFSNQGTSHSCHRCEGKTCSLCMKGCLQLEPGLLVCSGQCNASRIKKGAVYYITKDGQYQYCDQCYHRLPSALVQRNESHRYKQELLKRKNDEEIAEQWIACSECSAAAHSVCAMHNFRVHDERQYRCVACRGLDVRESATSDMAQSSVNDDKGQVYTFVTGVEEPVPIQSIKNRDTQFLDSDSLAECAVSAFIQAKVHNVLQKMPNADKTVTVRVISDSDRSFVVPKAVRRYFRAGDDGPLPETVQYRQKAIAMFQKIDGLDVCVFCMYCQEYGQEETGTGKKRVYISYIDSVEHFRPRELRTDVFHEILIAYLATARKRGFHQAHIWACPPSRGNCFVFWNHPISQRTPTSERLLAWYHGALSRAIDTGVVADVKSLYESDFEQQLAELSNNSRMVSPPLIDGDFWIEEVVRVYQTAIDRNLKVRSPTEVCVWNVGDQTLCHSSCPALQIGSLLKDRIMTHPSSVPFRRPVNAAAMKLKKYHVLIKKPIDLGTIYARCILGSYEKLQNVIDDIELMVENSQKFNSPSHIVNKMASDILELFHSELDNLTKQWNAGSVPAEMSMSLDVTVDMECPEASPEEASDTAIVVIEDDRSSDGTASLSASVTSVASHPCPTIRPDNCTEYVAKRSRQSQMGRRRGRPKVPKTLAPLDIFTDGPEAVMQRMVGEDTWMLDRRKTEPPMTSSSGAGHKRRRSLCGGTAKGGDQAPKKKRQSWLCEEVGQTIRRMRMSFFTCSLLPNAERSVVEEAKLQEYNDYASCFCWDSEAAGNVRSSLADSRSAVLELSQFRNWEFDSLRSAKFSTCMLLYHIHHSDAPGCVPECTSCGALIECVRWHKANKIYEMNKPKKGPSRKKSIAKPETAEVPAGPSNEDLCTTCYEASRSRDESFIPIPVSFK
ncbi:MAG: hypothetical protein SGILL_006589 [Bacillariaceae sp.]